MRKQFIVDEKDLNKRKEFYNYIVNTYDFKVCYPYTKESFINNKFPFVVDFNEKKFWISDSITCLACAAQNKVIFTIDDFFNQKPY